MGTYVDLFPEANFQSLNSGEHGNQHGGAVFHFERLAVCVVDDLYRRSGDPQHSWHHRDQGRNNGGNNKVVADSPTRTLALRFTPYPRHPASRRTNE